MSQDNLVYGTRADQIHPFFKAKREWSKIKDRIVGDYIACYLKTIQRRGSRPFSAIRELSYNLPHSASQCCSLWRPTGL